MAINYSYPEIGALATGDLLTVVDISNGNRTNTLEIGDLSNFVKGDFPEYNDNADALTGGEAIGTLYRTGDIVKVVH